MVLHPADGYSGIMSFMGSLDCNIHDVALICEGGGMRASYTSGAIVTMLERGINFPKAYGISAGSSLAVNYVSRDKPRTKASFVDLTQDPKFGGIGSFLRGNGYFNAPHLYEGLGDELAGTDEVMSFDWDTFCANPADVHVESFECDTGKTKFWTKADMPTMHQMMVQVRASSTMPIFMPPVQMDGHTYMDGGLGENWGIPLGAAKRDGYERFFIIRSQKRSYRKKPMGSAAKAVFRMVFRKHPLVAQRSIERWQYYNAICDEIEQLEQAGQAYVFYADKMEVSNRETNLEKLQRSYDNGYAQAQREADAWETWLQIGPRA